MAEVIPDKTRPHVAGVLEQEDKRSNLVAAALEWAHAEKAVSNRLGRDTNRRWKAAKVELLKAVAQYELAIGEYDWKGEEPC